MAYFPAQQILALHLQFTVFLNTEINMKNLHNKIAQYSFMHQPATDNVPKAHSERATFCLVTACYQLAMV
jgi:hypothetical protein